uniref:MACPF domain-containing protein n=1 Tax=Strigamia maritima TaxID=126957 RepID=T1IMG9_STRMM
MAHIFIKHTLKNIKLHLKPALILILLLTIYAQEYPPISEKCNPHPTNEIKEILNQFPGFSWDALTAQAGNFIFKLTYKNCSKLYSKFGGHHIEFLLAPDQVMLNSPRKLTNSYENFVMSTAELKKTSALIQFTSINTHFPPSPIEGTLNPEFKKWKNSFKEHLGDVYRRQVKIERFEANLKSNLELNETFVKMVNAVLDEQERENDNFALNKLKTLMENYGTHYTISAVYGGNAFIDSYGAHGAASRITYNVNFVGGDYELDPNSAEWEKSTAENAEIISVTGDFIYVLLDRPEFKKYSLSVRQKVYSKLYDHVKNYYK